MIRFVSTWPFRVGAGLILALLLGDYLSPAKAHAGCGEHQTAYRVGAPPARPLPSPLAPACTGPSCSRPQRPLPLPLTVKFSLPRAEAQLPDPPGEAGADGRQGWLRRDDSHGPVRTSTSIFHPPR